jgi:hypothetical protein
MGTLKQVQPNEISSSPDMWRRLKNLFFSFSTYADLSPDLRTKRQVQRFLGHRPALNAQDWYEKFWEPLEVTQSVANFVYLQMQQYSDLEFARVRPSDRLNEDLQIPLVCWFDWELRLCDDFCNWFGIDVSDRFDPNTFSTIQDLVMFLNHQLRPVICQSERSDQAS